MFGLIYKVISNKVLITVNKLKRTSFFKSFKIVIRFILSIGKLIGETATGFVNKMKKN